VRARLKEIGFCDVPNKPNCSANDLYFCAIQEAGPTCHQNQAPTDTGWCYVDPAVQPDDDKSLVAKCPATQQRILRFVDPMNNTPAHDATLLIACFGSSLPAETQ
jgi:hypothetical protein